jgi:hypothetical protein
MGRNYPAMPRPATGRKGQNVTLYLNRIILAAAKRHAFDCETSLSELLNTLLSKELRESKGRCRKGRTRSLH